MSMLKELLLKNLTLFYISAAAFLIGIPAGAVAYPAVADKLPSVLKEVFAGVMVGGTIEVVVKVFLRNLTASLIMLLLGFTVVLALLALFLNGFLVGLVFMLSLDRGLNILHLMGGVIPHGIFELPALFTSTAAGMNIGVQAVKSKGRRITAASQAIKEAAAIYLTTVLPLLVFAAIVEILVSRNLIK